MDSRLSLSIESLSATLFSMELDLTVTIFSDVSWNHKSTLACVITKEKRKTRGSICLTLSLVAKLSLGVSSDWEPVAHTVGPKEDACSSATLFSVRCLVTMSWWSEPTMKSGYYFKNRRSQHKRKPHNCEKRY